jgi:hypothetical protein
LLREAFRKVGSNMISTTRSTLFLLPLLVGTTIAHAQQSFDWRYYRPSNTGIQGDYCDALYVGADGNPCPQWGGLPHAGMKELEVRVLPNGYELWMSCLSRGIAVLKVTQATPGCDTIDFNNDALFPDDNDLIDFLAVLAGGTCPTGSCNDIDFNNDGLFPDDNDLLAFLRVLAGGSC